MRKLQSIIKRKCHLVTYNSFLSPHLDHRDFLHTKLIMETFVKKLNINTKHPSDIWDLRTKILSRSKSPITETKAMFQAAPLFSFKIQSIGLCQLIICMTLFQHQQNIKPSCYFLQTPKLKPDCLGIHFPHTLKMSRTSQITIWSLSKVEEKTLKFD